MADIPDARSCGCKRPSRYESGWCGFSCNYAKDHPFTVDDAKMFVREIAACLPFYHAGQSLGDWHRRTEAFNTLVVLSSRLRLLYLWARVEDSLNNFEHCVHAEPPSADAIERRKDLSR